MEQISNLTEFKPMIMQMLAQLRRRMGEHNDNFNKVIEKNKKVPNKSYN